jgi:hypothetical protein
MTHELAGKGMEAKPRTGPSTRRSLLAGVVFLMVMVAIQWTIRAYQSEQGNFSDDAAHFMNGLLVRDYLTEGLGQNPITFAREYYNSYPKIAPGMWPPLFHIGLGMFLLPHWPPHGAALLLLAAIAAWAAWRLYWIVSLFASRATGFLIGLLFLSTHIVVVMTSNVMLDAVLAALALEATYWLARFIRSGQWQHAAIFGLFTAMSCLTKANGISIVLAAPVAILLSGRLDLLRRSGLYIAAAIVVVLSLPPLLMTFRLTSAIGDFGPVTNRMVFDRLVYYCGFLWWQLGPAAVVLAVIGIVDSIRRGRHRQEDSRLPVGQVLTGLVAGSFIFHLFNPHYVATGRYMTLAIAPLYGLAAVGLHVAGGFIAGQRRHTIHAALLGVMVVTTFFARPALTVSKPFGYRDVVDQVEQRGGVAGKRVLVVSDEKGEGAFVTDIAIRQAQPRPTIVRGSKLLGSDNWNGHNFMIKFDSAQTIIQELEDLHVSYLVIDSAPEAKRLPYWPLMTQLTESYEDRVQLEYQNTVDPRKGPTRPLALYRVKYQSPGPPKELRTELTQVVREFLQR